MRDGKTCSKRCASIKGYLAGNHKETGIEIKLQEALVDLNIEYVIQKPLLGICVADVVVRPNVVLFADGKYWHTRPGIEYKDRKITRELQKKGFIVLRLGEDEINKDIETVKKKIQEAYSQRLAEKKL